MTRTAKFWLLTFGAYVLGVAIGFYPAWWWPLGGLAWGVAAALLLPDYFRFTGFRPCVVELRQTCMACPSQWEGRTRDGRYVYIRYRWGHLTWGLGASPDLAVRASMHCDGIHSGDDLDGTLDTSSMVKMLTDLRFERWVWRDDE